MYRKKFFAFFFFIFSVVSFSSAQKTSVYTDIYKEYKEALELFDHQKFVAAQVKFRTIESRARDFAFRKDGNYSLIRTNAEYYTALCALELYNNDAETLLLNFVEKYPENPRAKIAFFQIGKFYYLQKDYKNALLWFNKTDEYDLSDKDYNEYHFKAGYSFFIEQNFRKAKEHFEKIKDSESKYAYPANYYFSFICYQNNEFEPALTGFRFLRGSKTYSDVAPYFIASIFYKTLRFDSVINLSNEVLGKIKLQHEQEIYEILAMSYFRKEKYAEAVSRFEIIKKSDNSFAFSSADLYSWGFSEFSLNNPEKAIAVLEKLDAFNDVFAHNGMMILAKCFLLKDDQQAARNAFAKAMKLPGAKSSKETALINFAKLSFELNYHEPAISSLRDFIKKQGSSSRVNEAKSLLSEVLLTTKSYKEAWMILEEIPNRNNNANLVYQRVTYFNGVEYFNNKKIDSAIDFFNKSLEYNFDKTIFAEALYWKAEAHVLKNETNPAIESYRRVLASQDNANSSLYGKANYGLGYLWYKKEDYEKAAVCFEASSKSKTDTRLLYDSYLRLGDCQFVLRDYDKALNNYARVETAKAAGQEYALFQKSMIYGLQNRIAEKITGLEKLLAVFPRGDYADDANYELAYTLFVQSKPKEAFSRFENLVKNYPNSSYVARAKLNMGLISFNDNQDEKALQLYKSIITEFPGSSEGKEALQLIKNIYIEQGNADEYLSYIKSIPYASITPAGQDSISFEAANNRYLQGDCEHAIDRFTKYIERFKEGYFLREAHFYMADCQLRKGDSLNALNNYLFNTNNAKNPWTEKSLLQTANIYRGQQKFAEAAEFYKRLSEVAEFKENHAFAIAGAMDAYHQAGNDEACFQFSKQVKRYESSSKENINKAYLYSGDYFYKKSMPDSAATELQYVTQNTKNESGAEARYLLAKIKFEQGLYLESQNLCFDLSNQVPSYEYWVAKAFILLAENYSKLGNNFQAKSTLQSILDEYSNETDGIKEETKKKLELLNTTK